MRRRQKNRKLDILKQSRGRKPMPRPAVFRNRKKYDRNIRKNLDCRRVEPNAAHRVLAWPEIHYC